MFSLGRLLNTTATIVEPIARTSVDPAEIGHFTAMAEDWLDESGPMKVLHAFNRVRIPWIVDELKRVCSNQS
jgi:2-polyprenyl-3-methyl-5-hydroxy-6-metoxy-1,4-benzoquinol methylase